MNTPTILSGLAVIFLALFVALKTYGNDTTVPWGATIAVIGVAIVVIASLPTLPDNNQEDSDEQ